MNKDQVKGVGKQIQGEVQQQVGKLTGDTSTRIKGHANEAEGKLQEGVGNAKETLRDNERDLERAEERNRDLKR
jgi:uncharacterized protein YjbJ (UPF0337 family)